MTTLYDNVTFKSLCKAPVLCRYNYSENKVDYWIHPGETYQYPRMMYDLFKKNLIDHFIIENRGKPGMNTGNAEMRRKIEANMILSQGDSGLPAAMTLEQMAIEQSHTLNAEKIAAPAVDNEIFEGLNQNQPTPVTMATTIPEEQVSPAVEPATISGNGKVGISPTPTKEVLQLFAVNTLKMTVDENFIKLFEKPAAELAVELGYYE